jgi:hypothetical protein
MERYRIATVVNTISDALSYFWKGRTAIEFVDSPNRNTIWVEDQQHLMRYVPYQGWSQRARAIGAHDATRMRESIAAVQPLTPMSSLVWRWTSSRIVNRIGRIGKVREWLGYRIRKSQKELRTKRNQSTRSSSAWCSPKLKFRLLK